MKYIMTDAAGEKSLINLKLRKRTILGIGAFSLVAGFVQGMILNRLFEQDEVEPLIGPYKIDELLQDAFVDPNQR